MIAERATVNRERLLEAAAMIDQVTAELNAERNECVCCGSMRAQNLGELRAHETLTAMSEKLKGLAGAFGPQEDAHGESQ